MRIFYSFISILFLTFNGVHGSAPEKPWTFLVYIAAANDLNPFADLDLAEMKTIGSNNKVNVIVYLTITPHDQEKITQKIYVEHGNLVIEPVTPARDSGTTDTLVEALTWAHADYPSEHLAVVLWDHGSGGALTRRYTLKRGICYDYPAASYLTDVTYHAAFDTVVKNMRGGKKIDIVAFDACLMATVEDAYALSTVADYMVASQETIPGKGYDYAKALAPFALGVLDVEKCAAHMVNVYGQTYANSGEDYTLSAIRLNKVSLIAASISRASQALDRLLSTYAYAKNVVARSADQCRYVTETDFVDAQKFFEKSGALMPYFIKKQDATAYRNAAQGVVNTVQQALVTRVASPSRAKATGLCIYLPRKILHPSYLQSLWANVSPWRAVVQKYTAAKLK